MAIDFELSGQGPSAAEDISLADIQEAAVECGFTKPSVPASKPNAQRANLTAFFKALGVTCVSGFKKRFHAEKLPCPYPDMTPLIMEKVRFSRSRGGPRRGVSARASNATSVSARPLHARRSGHTRETLTTFPKHFFFPEHLTGTNARNEFAKRNETNFLQTETRRTNRKKRRSRGPSPTSPSTTRSSRSGRVRSGACSPSPAARW